MANHRVTFADLDARQRRIVVDKRFAERMTTRALLDLLVPLPGFEVTRARLATRNSILVGLMIFVNFFAFMALAASKFAWPLIPIPAACLALFVLFVVRSSRLARQAQTQKLPRLVLPLLAVLAEEIEDGTPVALDLDLRAANLAPKLERTESLPPTPRFDKITLRVYRDPWMRGEAQLRDGARLRWTVSDEVREVDRRRNTGKRKTKTKAKNRSTLALVVTLPKGSHAGADPADAAPAGAGVRVSREGKRDQIELARTIKSDTIDAPEAVHFLDLMAQVVTRARSLATAGRAPRP